LSILNLGLFALRGGDPRDWDGIVFFLYSVVDYQHYFHGSYVLALSITLQGDEQGQNDPAFFLSSSNPLRKNKVFLPQKSGFSPIDFVSLYYNLFTIKYLIFTFFYIAPRSEMCA
jgi:hypothetical protein